MLICRPQYSVKRKKLKFNYRPEYGFRDITMQLLQQDDCGLKKTNYPQNIFTSLMLESGGSFAI